jgi:hypothetical protein
MRRSRRLKGNLPLVAVEIKATAQQRRTYRPLNPQCVFVDKVTAYIPVLAIDAIGHIGLGAGRRAAMTGKA